MKVQDRFKRCVFMDVDKEKWAKELPEF